MEVCLINMNKGEGDEGCLKFCNILKWSLKLCKEITVGLFRKYSTLWQHKGESQIRLLKILYTLAGGPLNFEGLGLSLSSVSPAQRIATSVRVESVLPIVVLYHLLMHKNTHFIFLLLIAIGEQLIFKRH
jgi:hypothetical protein